MCEACATSHPYLVSSPFYIYHPYMLTFKCVEYFIYLFVSIMVAKHSNLSCQRSSSCVNIRIHGIGERGSYLLHNFPCKRECRAIYSRVSQLLGVPSQLLTLSTGVKILRRGLPLQTYISDLNLSNGLSLYCNIIIQGGGKDDDKLDGESYI